MTSVVTKLIDCHQLEQLDSNLFRGYSSGMGGRRVYGGDVLAQALSAGQQTVEADYQLHSLHAYFLRPGDPKKAIIYDVDPIREGNSFCTRRVVARQNGQAIFSAAVSFQVAEEGFSHQVAMPEVPGPDNIVSDDQIYQEFFKSDKAFRGPVEFRQVAPMDLHQPEPREPVAYVWFRAAEALPDAPAIHQRLLAYASDNPLLVTALRPHGVSFMDRNMMVISLDHALWYHRPFRIDDWLLFEVHSDTSSGGRGLSRGRIFNRDGDLVVTASQEGLIRRRRQ